MEQTGRIGLEHPVVFDMAVVFLIYAIVFKTVLYMVMDRVTIYIYLLYILVLNFIILLDIKTYII